MQNETHNIESALRRCDRPEFVGFSPFVPMVEFEPLAPVELPVDPVLEVPFGALANASCEWRLGCERHNTQMVATKRRAYQSKVPANDRSRAERVRHLRAVCCLVQVAERLAVLPVCGVVPHGLYELVPHGCLGHRPRGPDLPV